MPRPISDTPIVRGSEITDLKRCPQKWWWAWREGLVPRGRISDPLWFGILVHEALAAWYCGPGLKRGPHPAETFLARATDELRFIKTTDATEDEVAKYTDLRDLGAVLMEVYLDHYGRDDSWWIISPEQTFSIDVPFSEAWTKPRGRELLARFNGTFDLAYRDLKSDWIWLGETKTAATISLGHLPLDDQAGRYWLVAHRSLVKQGLIKESDHLAGIMYNFVRKALPDPRPVDAKGYACNLPKKEDFIRAIEAKRPGGLDGKEKLETLREIAAGLDLEVLGERSKVQPKPILLRHPVPRTRGQRKSQLVRLQNDLTVMELYRRGEIPLTKTTHKSCERWCQFYQMCLLHEASSNWRDLRKVGFTQQDPYADHRKSAEDTGSFEL